LTKKKVKYAHVLALMPVHAKTQVGNIDPIGTAKQAIHNFCTWIVRHA